jgi:Fe-S cluster assembly protein SufD
MAAPATAAALIERSRSLDAGPEDAVRAAAREQLARRGIALGRRLETWKYTPIEPFYTDDLIATPNEARAGIEVGGAAAREKDLRIERRAPAAAIERGVAVDTDRHPLALVNLALADDVLCIDVPSGIVIDEPLRLSHRTEANHARCTRVRVRLGPGSQLTLHEEADERVGANRVLHVDIGEGAILRHERVEGRVDVACWSLVTVDVAAKGAYDAALYEFTGTPRRADVHVRLNGRGARVDLAGVQAAAGRGAIDLSVVVEHFGPETVCRERVHGVAGGHGQLTFNGRIQIHGAADGADAALQNRNLLLAPTARVNTKPELEIGNRDVRCSHGATVGQIDPGQLFYLRSRGIGEAEAMKLLLHAFIAQCLSPAARAAGLDLRFAEVLGA